MHKIQNRAELLKMYENVKEVLDFRAIPQPLATIEQFYISVCGGTGCSSQDSLLLVEK